MTNPVIRPPALTLAAAALTLLTAALWGGTTVAVKFTADTLPPVAIAAFRFALAAGSIGLWAWLGGQSLAARWRDLPSLSIVGFLLFAQIALFNVAIDWSNASHGTVLINVYVFFVIALEHFVTRMDRLTTAKCGGLALAAMGVVLTMTAAGTSATQAADAPVTDAPRLSGDLVMLASALVLSIRVAYTKAFVRRLAPLSLVFWQHVVGTLLFVAVSLPLEGVGYLHASSFTLPVLGGLAYQGIVVGGFCFVLHTMLLNWYSATQISVFSFATPLFGVCFAVLFRGDPLTLPLAAAGVCIAAGIYLVTAQRARQAAGDEAVAAA